MSSNTLPKRQITDIFRHHDIPIRPMITRAPAGFNHEVYSVDDAYMLKLCGNEDFQEDFRREFRLYEFFKGTLPTPSVLVYDDSKSICPRPYMIYKKIAGTNLYDVWHTLGYEERRGIIGRLCELLKTINTANVANLPADLELQKITSWKNHFLTRITDALRDIEDAKSLNEPAIAEVRAFVEAHKTCLDEQILRLTFWDVHFDNILVQDAKIVGILDLEHTNIRSIDYVLHTVRRMIEDPKKYMARDKEYLAKREDYSHLLKWYREFYPKLFDFTGLDHRVDFYTLTLNLEELADWPDEQWLKDDVSAIAKGTYPGISSYLS
jgi:aminoglycoside phosphotransferase (APT) family kinase protein